jgi:ATP:ADP antiporter, AAA family
LTAEPSPPAARGLLDRLLAPFADVHAGEAPTALLLTLNVFLLLTCYYILKPVREALILAGEGPEVKSYAAAGQVLFLLGFVPAYGALASRVDRMRLITGVTLFFVSCLVGFYFLAGSRVPHLGLMFFIWIGIFSLSIIAQFWSYANDLYTPEAGKRLFAIIAFGSTLGAIVGATITKLLIAPLGVRQLLLVAGAVLLASLGITRIVDAREGRRAARVANAAPEQPIRGESGFTLVLRDRYLLLIGLLVLVLNLVNATGEYILGKTLTEVAKQNVAAGLAGALSVDEYKQQLIGGFFAGYQLTVNIVTAIVQLFLVSRILKWFGVRIALFVLPVIALGGYGLLAVAPILGTVRLVKIAENSTDYSLQNTARQALFLPTSREAKYKAKSAIDTFFYRTGDLFSAGLVFVGTRFALTPQRFSLINVVLVLIWLGLAALIGRRYAELTGEGEKAPAGAEPAPVRG